MGEAGDHMQLEYKKAIVLRLETIALRVEAVAIAIRFFAGNEQLGFCIDELIDEVAMSTGPLRPGNPGIHKAGRSLMLSYCGESAVTIGHPKHCKSQGPSPGVTKGWFLVLK